MINAAGMKYESGRPGKNDSFLGLMFPLSGFFRPQEMSNFFTFA